MNRPLLVLACGLTGCELPTAGEEAELHAQVMQERRNVEIVSQAQARVADRLSEILTAYDDYLGAVRREVPDPRSGASAAGSDQVPRCEALQLKEASPLMVSWSTLHNARLGVVALNERGPNALDAPAFMTLFKKPDGRSHPEAGKAFAEIMAARSVLVTGAKTAVLFDGETPVCAVGPASVVSQR